MNHNGLSIKLSEHKQVHQPQSYNHMLTSRLDMQFHNLFLTALYHQGISQTLVPGHHHTSPHGGHIPYTMSPIAHNYMPDLTTTKHVSNQQL